MEFTSEFTEDVTKKSINVKDGNIFLYFEKNSTCICRNKKWQDCNLATNTQLVRFNGVSPGKDKYIRKRWFLKYSKHGLWRHNYGFIYEGKIYLNSDVMNSNAVVHSEEFISKFGDWEKVSRLKNLLKHLQSLSVILSKRLFICVCPDNSVENSRQKANIW